MLYQLSYTPTQKTIVPNPALRKTDGYAACGCAPNAPHAGQRGTRVTRGVWAK